MSDKKRNWILLIVRLIIGGIFIFAGWAKVADMTSTVGFFATLGIPAFLAYVVGYLGLIGGILLVLGIWTQKSAAILAIIMIVAVWITMPGGFQAFNTPLSVLAGLLSIMASGSGSYVVGLKRNKSVVIA